jgi:hypothetical protein
VISPYPTKKAVVETTTAPETKKPWATDCGLPTALNSRTHVQQDRPPPIAIVVIIAIEEGEVRDGHFPVACRLTVNSKPYSKHNDSMYIQSRN